MRKLRILSVLAGFAVLALAGTLSACSNPGASADSGASSGMIGGKGPDYNRD